MLNYIVKKIVTKNLWNLQYMKLRDLKNTIRVSQYVPASTLWTSTFEGFFSFSTFRFSSLALFSPLTRPFLFLIASNTSMIFLTLLKEIRQRFLERDLTTSTTRFIPQAPFWLFTVWRHDKWREVIGADRSSFPRKCRRTTWGEGTWKGTWKISQLIPGLPTLAAWQEFMAGI